MRYIIFILTLFLLTIMVSAQQLTQTIKGKVVDQDSEVPLPYVNVVLLDTDPIIGSTTDDNGNFILENVPVGRYSLQVSFIGYESVIVTELIVSSSKVSYVEISMKENAVSLGEIVIKPRLHKEKVLNKMATVSARMLSVEEAKRYAGGFDDPARLASSFAGVASGVNSNAIIVRGNAPKSLQWKMEGIEIPNPNHFADLTGMGGGALTALSGQLLANSDFFTGAFPAEYNNALSGVFDIFMRTGNNEDYEHTLQVGVMGIDVASEGPFKKGKNASYLFNYRYSTFGLVGQITNANEGIDYQDLSFKLNFPTKKAGVFSVWGLGLIDGAKVKIKDSEERYYSSDKEDYDAKQFMATTGINHKIFINDKSLLKTTLATTVSGIDWKIKRLDAQEELLPQSNIENTTWNFVLNSSLNTKISKKHTNKIGFTVTGMQYNILLEDALVSGTPLTTITDETGFSTLLSAYSSSAIHINNRLTVNMGLNAQLFTLNNNFTIEPRIGAKWQWTTNQQIGFGYGLHSRLERLNYFFTRDALTGEFNNQDMDFTKAHHFVLSYSNNLSKNLLLKVEPYYQILFNVPVVANSSFSFINLRDNWFINDKFENTGKGRNYGVDITLEKYLTKGYYFMLTTSLFNSEYTGGDGIWRNTRFNMNYLFNLLGGREWNLGKNKQNVLGLNIRLTYQGGERFTPYKLGESIIAEEVVFDETNAFSQQIDPAFIAHFTASYRINKKNTSHEFALKVLNATSYGDFQGFQYNFIEQTVDENRETIMIPNLSYKIEF
ncbi:MAG: carboxypeptidase-like regulatory domain-containing protein [Flavobacteriaceae bacterium]|nr:carboxypeptidase-like regulatory domain-containing protein [Flavobacteriaceae bacterium]